MLVSLLSPSSQGTSQGTLGTSTALSVSVSPCQGLHSPRQAGSSPASQLVTQSGVLMGDKRGHRGPRGLILQKSKNKNARMVTSGRAWGDLNGGSVPAEGQGKRPHAACPSCCLGQTGHGEQEQQRRVSSWGEGPQGQPSGPQKLWLLLDWLPSTLIPALLSEAVWRAWGTALGDVGMQSWTCWLPLQVGPAEHRWQETPQGAGGELWVQDGGVPLRSAPHLSLPAHQYHRGIDPLCWCQDTVALNCPLLALVFIKRCKSHSSWVHFRGDHAIIEHHNFELTFPCTQGNYEKSEAGKGTNTITGAIGCWGG